MNRLKILLLTTALIAGTSAVASAEEHDHDGRGHQNRYSDHDRDDRYRNGYYGYYGDGDHDRDDGYRGRYVYEDRDDCYRNRRWRDRDDRWRRHDNRRRRDWDHDDGDRD